MPEPKSPPKAPTPPPPHPKPEIRVPLTDRPIRKDGIVPGSIEPTWYPMAPLAPPPPPKKGGPLGPG